MVFVYAKLMMSSFSFSMSWMVNAVRSVQIERHSFYFFGIISM